MQNLRQEDCQVKANFGDTRIWGQHRSHDILIQNKINKYEKQGEITFNYFNSTFIHWKQLTFNNELITINEIFCIHFLLSFYNLWCFILLDRSHFTAITGGYIIMLSRNGPAPPFSLKSKMKCRNSAYFVNANISPTQALSLVLTKTAIYMSKRSTLWPLNSSWPNKMAENSEGGVIKTGCCE